jgi:hypothetical protein
MAATFEISLSSKHNGPFGNGTRWNGLLRSVSRFDARIFLSLKNNNRRGHMRAHAFFL